MSREDDQLWEHEGRELKRSEGYKTCDSCDQEIFEDEPTAHDLAEREGKVYPFDDTCCAQCYGAYLIEEAQSRLSE